MFEQAQYYNAYLVVAGYLKGGGGGWNTCIDIWEPLMCVQRRLEFLFDVFVCRTWALHHALTTLQRLDPDTADYNSTKKQTTPHHTPNEGIWPSVFHAQQSCHGHPNMGALVDRFEFGGEDPSIFHLGILRPPAMVPHPYRAVNYPSKHSNLIHNQFD